jgi:hypothetical protein
VQFTGFSAGPPPLSFFVGPLTHGNDLEGFYGFRMPRRLLIAALGCFVATGCAVFARPTVSGMPLCAAAARIDTNGWRRMDAGPYVFRLPAEFEEQEVRSVDSAVKEWRAPDGREVHSDYGFYTGPFELGPPGPMQELFAVCGEGSDETAPQIVLYRTHEDRYAAGLYWPKPGGRKIPFGRDARLQPEALWMSVQSSRPEDQARLLAIVLSVRYK